MNKTLTSALALACFMGLLTSCAEDAFVSYDNIKPKLVVQSRLLPDSSFKIVINSTLTPTDESPYVVPDEMSVSLISSSNSVINLYRENGIYVAPQSFPKIGESYTLIITSPGLPSVETRTSIPEPVELVNGIVQNLRLVPSELTPDKLNVSYDLRLDFKPNAHQYFHFVFVQTTTLNVGTVDEQEYLYYINPEFPAEGGYYQDQETGVLLDAIKTGSENTLTFSFVDYTLGDLEQLGNLYIEVRTVTPEYYLYNTSLARQLISRDDPFSEPIPVYNNIKGGSGNFSGYSSRWYQIPIIP